MVQLGFCGNAVPFFYVKTGSSKRLISLERYLPTKSLHLGMGHGGTIYGPPGLLQHRHCRRYNAGDLANPQPKEPEVYDEIYREADYQW